VSAAMPIAAPTEGRAYVSATLAHVGQELTRARAKPILFERLCSVALEALRGDASSTLLRDGRSRGYLPVARQGAARRFAHLADPGHPIAIEVTRRLRNDNVIELPIRIEGPDSEQAPSRWLCIALRRDTNLAGIVVVGRIAQEMSFSADDVAIAEGIGRLGSLCLENARLMSENERANHIKSDFVATMSHELRTPLHIILGYLSLLLEGDFGMLSEEQLSALGHIDRSAHALLELVQDTLDLSRLESDALPITRKEIDVRELFASMSRETERLPRTDAVGIHWRATDDVPLLQSDPGKLQIILKNLVSNALKFTPTGLVSITARPCADGIEFAVTDTGVGVPRGQFSRIFEPFTQLGRASTRTHGGVGMGLYVARRLTELLGGTIAVSSRVGSGSTFQVWIPAVAPAAGNRSSFDSPRA
jgi:signal transduction histidine kinase